MARGAEGASLTVTYTNGLPVLALSATFQGVRTAPTDTVGDAADGRRTRSMRNASCMHQRRVPHAVFLRWAHSAPRVPHPPTAIGGIADGVRALRTPWNVAGRVLEVVNYWSRQLSGMPPQLPCPWDGPQWPYIIATTVHSGLRKRTYWAECYTYMYTLQL